MPEVKNFPEGFYWGAATSAHQVEGDNINDWSEWERSEDRIKSLKFRGLNPSDFISGKACDSYNRYEEDFNIAKELNHNIHRFSIEWSRVEPKEGEFNEKEMEHYKRLIDALCDRGMEPMVTLWHFTNPIWFAGKGGFLNDKSPGYFTRYIKYVVDNLKDKVKLWVTLNEATTVYSSLVYLKGEWLRKSSGIFDFMRARRNFLKSHTLAYQEIKKIYKEKYTNSDNPAALGNMSHNVMVGLVENNNYLAAGLFTKLIGAERLFDNFWNHWLFSKALPYYDFLGLNYYNIKRLPGSYESLPKQDVAQEMDWEIYPQGIHYILKRLKKYKKPIFVTENGIADGADKKREKFIKEHLSWIFQAIQDGVDVRGYMYWSLLDNFEWARGFGPRFGLAEIDYKTFERKIRSSALEYAKICKDNSLSI